MTTITTSRVGVVIDALVSLLNASATFADPVRVLDGPVTSGNTMYTQAVYVGFDGDWRTDGHGTVAPHITYDAAAITQEFAYLGNTSMHESLEVLCAAEAWSGDPTTKTVRDQCLSMLAGVEDVIRTDPSLGIDSSTIATMRVGNLAYMFDDGGNLAARVPFTVHVDTIISTV